MMRLSKIRGAFEKRPSHNKEKQRHAEKIKNIKKNIERPIIAEFKTNFYQGVFYGFSK
ncbi:hypothetical protein VN0039_13910 [Helicobacter pylori]